MPQPGAIGFRYGDSCKPPYFWGFVVFSVLIPQSKTFVDASATVYLASIASGTGPVAKYPSATAIRNPRCLDSTAAEKVQAGVECKLGNENRALQDIVQQRHIPDRSPKPRTTQSKLLENK